MAETFSRVVLGVSVVVFSILVYLIANQVLVSWTRALPGKTKSQWDDALCGTRFSHAFRILRRLW